MRWGLVPKPKSILRTERVVNSFMSSRVIKVNNIQPLLDPWGEQSQEKVKGRGQSALGKRGSGGVESAGRPYVQDCRAVESMGESFQYPPIPSPKVGVVIFWLQRRLSSKSKIICPFLHYYYKQKPPSTPKKVIILKCFQNNCKRESGRVGMQVLIYLTPKSRSLLVKVVVQGPLTWASPGIQLEMQIL